MPDGMLRRDEASAMRSDEHQFHLAIDSRLENIELVQVVLNDTLERLGLDEDVRHWVDLATREAVANAIKHGNDCDRDKTVEVDVSVDGADVVVRVADQGGGFDPGRVEDPLAPENLLRPTGRGLFYMQKFMDRVDYGTRAGGGTVVTLRKQVFAPGAAAAAAAPNGDSDGGER
ncbi:MAG TPA: ATP-binding protein [Thermoanaerobaculia bacterium]|nr:ATP-binding protein [Thermoanaerobaculia bacterium]